MGDSGADVYEIHGRHHRFGGHVAVRAGRCPRELGDPNRLCRRDFTDNVIRFLTEERLTQTIERPQAICVISKLPLVAAAETPAKTTSRK
jgi:hypothetical protein